MMGSNDKPQDELFYAFNLDEIVPQDHLLRDIDRVLDLHRASRTPRTVLQPHRTAFC